MAAEAAAPEAAASPVETPEVAEEQEPAAGGESAEDESSPDVTGEDGVADEEATDARSPSQDGSVGDPASEAELESDRGASDTGTETDPGDNDEGDEAEDEGQDETDGQDAGKKKKGKKGKDKGGKKKKGKKEKDGKEGKKEKDDKDAAPAEEEAAPAPAELTPEEKEAAEARAKQEAREDEEAKAKLAYEEACARLEAIEKAEKAAAAAAKRAEEEARAAAEAAAAERAAELKRKEEEVMRARQLRNGARERAILEAGKKRRAAIEAAAVLEAKLEKRPPTIRPQGSPKPKLKGAASPGRKGSPGRSPGRRSRKGRSDSEGSGSEEVMRLAKEATERREARARAAAAEEEARLQVGGPPYGHKHFLQWNAYYSNHGEAPPPGHPLYWDEEEDEDAGYDADELRFAARAEMQEAAHAAQDAVRLWEQQSTEHGTKYSSAEIEWSAKQQAVQQAAEAARASRRRGGPVKAFNAFAPRLYTEPSTSKWSPPTDRRDEPGWECVPGHTLPKDILFGTPKTPNYTPPKLLAERAASPPKESAIILADAKAGYNARPNKYIERRKLAAAGLLPTKARVSVDEPAPDWAGDGNEPSAEGHRLSGEFAGAVSDMTNMLSGLL